MSVYLSICPSICLSSVYLSIYLSVYLAIYLSIYLSIHLSIDLSIYLSIYLSFYLSIYLCLSVFLSIYLSLSVCLSIYLPIYLSVYLPDWKRSSSARLPHFSNLTTSKTKQFCDTFFFQPNNVQNRSNSPRLPQCLNLTTSKTKQFCETSFKNGTLSAALRASYQCVLRFFHSICHEKLMPGHTKCCTCHAKSSQQTWRSETPKCNPSQEMSALTSEHLWWTCLLYCTCHAKCIFEDPLQMPHACHRFWTCCKTLTFCSLLTRCTIFCACHAKRHMNLQKWHEHVVFCTFSLRHVLRGTTACTFSTSQLPKVVRQWCFVHFDIEMCFAPQRRALFRHRNFQKWSENGVLCTFWLRNVLRATTACTFLTSQLPKVLRDPGVLYLFTSKSASRHNGVQFSFLISPDVSAPAALASLLFDPPEPQYIEKTQCFATFLPFCASASSFFWLFLFSDLLSSNLSLLSASALLCFSSVHIVGSLTSKLPSTTLYHKAFPSTTLYYKACAKHFPVYFVLQSLHKALPRTTLYYKACTKTLYYKACTEHVPVLLCTTKLARSTSQYYFVLQSLHKALPSTTLYYKLTWQPAGHLRKGEVFAASPIDTATPQENQRLETRHVGAAKRAFRARHPPILTLSTRYQTGWNVTKFHACHAKRHDNLLGHLRKG